MRLLEEATKAVGALENTLLTVRESSSIRRVVLFIFRSLRFRILVIGWNGQHQHDWRRRTCHGGKLGGEGGWGGKVRNMKTRF
jgi:hypothetical protein